MKDLFQWTPELWCEFLNQRPLIGALETEMEQFKSSKAPNKEWEIVAYRVRKNKIFYTENSDDRGRIWDSQEKKGGYICGTDLSHRDVEIFSVRRLSDGEVFSVGDRIDWPWGKLGITGFKIENERLIVCHANGTLEDYKRCILEGLQKLPQPILTTVDGVEIYEGMEFWKVDNDLHLTHCYGKNWRIRMIGADKTFSTREAAEHYILQNRPLLSLNDVKESANATVKDYWLLMEALSIKVKQKLNP